MDIAGLLDVVESCAPWGLAEEWDNVGLIVGRRTREVTSVAVALDLRAAVIDAARAHGDQAILVHHPPIFPSVSSVSDAQPQSELILRAAELGIAVIAAHTNLDSAVGGLNDIMAELLGITDAQPLAPNVQHPGAGLGRVGNSREITLEGVFRRLNAALRGPITTTADTDQPVGRLACCTGSGASFIDVARDVDVDVYVTSDLKYHDADRAYGMTLVNIPHGQIEAYALARWVPTLALALSECGVVAHMSDVDTDPWQMPPPKML
jgi:dinuclear metal center YbgI/SA1388 family protein